MDGQTHAGRLDAAQLGAELGDRATLVQFSSAFCQPCRATRRTLDEVARMVDGVAHVEIDAEAHLTLVRELDISRTPTVLVLDAAWPDRPASGRAATHRRCRRGTGARDVTDRDASPTLRNLLDCTHHASSV